MKENRKPASQQMKKVPKRRRDQHALRNVVSLRISVKKYRVGVLSCH